MNTPLKAMSLRRHVTSRVVNSNSRACTLSRRVNYLKLIPYEDARKRIVAALASYVLSTESVYVDVAGGRICSEDIRSSKNLPSRHLAAMDGYALNSSATKGGSTSKPFHLIVEGSMFQGSDRKFRLERGHTCYVATGAPLPAGSDAVARVEEVRLDNDKVRITHPIEKWKNVFLPGEDYRKGDFFFEKHRILDASDIALLMSLGKKSIQVFLMPRVAILSIGDELRAFGSEESKNERTVNNYFNLIRGFISELNIDTDSAGICPDNPNSISELISRTLRTHDMIITIGGSSVGAKDFTVAAVSKIPRAYPVFHGIKIVPIRPTGLFVVAGKPVVVLPANAISVAASFFLVALPVLNLISGLTFEARKVEIRATSATSFENEKPLPALYLVTVKKTKGGTYVFYSLDWGSNLSYNLSKSNGFVILE